MTQLQVRIDSKTKNEAKKVSLQYFDGRQLIKRLDAKSMTWDEQNWILHTVIERTFVDTVVTTTKYKQLVQADLNFKPENLLELQKRPEEMSYLELQTFVKEMTAIGAEVRKWIVELYVKISYPFANFIIILFGAPILGVWYWCTDQFIVQRVLSASNIDQARRGTIFAGYLKILPLFIFVIPGVIAYVLAQKALINLETPDQALPVLIGVLLPVGLKGLVVAGLLAALMSSLSSVFNSCSTLFTWDIYKKVNPEASEKKLVLVGQIATLILVLLGLAWIPMMKHISGQIYQYLQSVQAYISPPIAAVFLIGIAWKRVNAEGAIASLISGFVLGMARLVAELNKDSLNEWLYWYADINFLHFAIFLFVVCTVILVIVSLLTPEPSVEQVEDLTVSTITTNKKEASGSSLWIKKDRLLSIVLFFIVCFLWWYFS